jgi:hypothetical protein
MGLLLEEFVARYGEDPDWAELLSEPHYRTYLRRALKGDRESFRELAVYGRGHQASPRMMRALWEAGAPVSPHRAEIKQQWQVEARWIAKAFGDELDSFFRDAEFSTARLPDEFDVWRGGIEAADVLSSAKSWSRSYPVACAFALQDKFWRSARLEAKARAGGSPKPIVLTRRIRRDQAIAYMGGPEREVVLATDALRLPAQPYGSLAEWRRHRARGRPPGFWG